MYAARKSEYFDFLRSNLLRRIGTDDAGLAYPGCPARILGASAEAVLPTRF